MDPHAHRCYLEAQVLTASPQKLRLMLIEAAIGLAQRTLRNWDEGQNEQAAESLIRCREMVSELLAGIKTDTTELTRRVAAVYLFLFQTLTEAQLHRDPERIVAAIQVLEVERDTWRMVCGAHPTPPPPAAMRTGPRENTASDAARLTNSPADRPGPGGLLLDA